MSKPLTPDQQRSRTFNQRMGLRPANAIDRERMAKFLREFGTSFHCLHSKCQWANIRRAVYAMRGDTAPPIKPQKHIPMMPQVALMDEGSPLHEEDIDRIVERLDQLNHNFLQMARARQPRPTTSQQSPRQPNVGRLPDATE